MAPDSVLLVSGLSVRTGMLTILDGVNLRVPAGEAVAIIGPTGAGKSTLARALMGLVSPTAGLIHLVKGQSRVPLELSPPWHRARLGIALVPETRHVFPDLTVSENLMAALSWMRVSPANSQELLNEVLAFCPALRGHLSQAAGTLSGGEKRLLGIARALLALRARAGQPDSGTNGYLIVDEPSHGLYPTMMTAVANVLRNVCSAAGVGILLLEQFEGFALKVCSRFHTIERGRLTLS